MTECKILLKGRRGGGTIFNIFTRSPVHIGSYENMFEKVLRPLKCPRKSNIFCMWFQIQSSVMPSNNIKVQLSFVTIHQVLYEAN